jgi:ParB-like chromosome segregation protein Spo0J
MKSFIKWIQIKESSGLNQVAGVGNDDENFYVKFSIKDLLDKAKKYPIQDVQISELLPMLSTRIENPEHTQARADKSELIYPIIVFANDQGNIFAIGDGTHRVQKAASLGLKTIKAHVIPKQDMLEFQTEPSIHSKNYKPNITKYTL